MHYMMGHCVARYNYYGGRMSLKKKGYQYCNQKCRAEVTTGVDRAALPHPLPCDIRQYNFFFCTLLYILIYLFPKNVRKLQ